MSTTTPGTQTDESTEPKVAARSGSPNDDPGGGATHVENGQLRANEPSPPADGSGGKSLPPAGRSIYKPDLNEVLLLLDFISGRPDVHILDIGNIKYPVHGDNAPPNGGATATLEPVEVIRRICQLRYPPEPGRPLSAQADDSALLLCVKDKLNAIAYPASGLTVAYTYMFVEERSSESVKSQEQEASEFVDEGSRAYVARDAYPGLSISAKRFRRFHRKVSNFGAAVTLLSALLLWLVAYGVQLTSRFEEVQKSADDLTAQIYAQVDKENAASAANHQTRDTVPVRCADAKNNNESNQVRLLCNRWSYYQRRYEKAINDVGAFSDRFPSSWLLLPFPISPTLQKNDAGKYAANQENIQSVTLALSAYASYVLPVLFGLIGTLASFLRDISNRLTTSVLAPRDETVAVIRLILGAIAGFAVGLFFAPATVAGQVNSGAGVLTLSASGIAFVAGFGADGFFRMLDALIARVFSLSGEKPSPK